MSTSPAGGADARPRIALPALPAPVDQLWHVLMDLAQALPGVWTLVGGQMVLLHAVERGHEPPQLSQDGDVMADVRAVPAAVSQLVDTLTQAGFEVDGASPDLVAHRFVRSAAPRPVTIDVLAPEGLGPHTRLHTAGQGRTVEVPGGTQALDRTELVDVHHEGRVVPMPRPSLLAALVAKAAACALPGDNSRHLRDLALLCALVPDPFLLADEQTSKDRRRLRCACALDDTDHPAWLLVPESIRDQGQAAYELLSGQDNV